MFTPNRFSVRYMCTPYGYVAQEITDITTGGVILLLLDADNAREYAAELIEHAQHLEDPPAPSVTADDIPAGSLRIRVRRPSFDPFFRFECPIHPQAGEGTYPEAAAAADAARLHYEQEHTS